MVKREPLVAKVTNIFVWFECNRLLETTSELRSWSLKSLKILWIQILQYSKQDSVEGFWWIIQLFAIPLLLLRDFDEFLNCLWFFLVYLLRQCKYFISNHFLWYQIFLKIDSFFDHLPILISYSDALFIYLCTKDFQFGENMLSASRATFIFF